MEFTCSVYLATSKGGLLPNLLVPKVETQTLDK